MAEKRGFDFLNELAGKLRNDSKSISDTIKSNMDRLPYKQRPERGKGISFRTADGKSRLKDTVFTVFSSLPSIKEDPLEAKVAESK
jgi:hypothetical protein